MVTSPRFGPVFFIGNSSRAHHRLNAAWFAMRKRAGELLFGRDFERHFLAEEVGLPSAVGDARSEPDGSGDFGGWAEVPPESQANEKAQYRRMRKVPIFFSLERT